MTAGADGGWTRIRRALLCCLMLSLPPVGKSIWSLASDAPPVTSSERSARLWQSLISQAHGLGLPTRFLRTIDPGFVTVDFEDLRAFAAEYHPEDHHMVLNRSLSFNAAGGTLKSLATLAPRDLGTLYHELFHAYLDYISMERVVKPKGSPAARILEFAGDRKECRYRHVTITPIPQRKNLTETRWLTDRESWEALNETWAVFIGWAVWTTLDVHSIASRQGTTANRRERQYWLKRLEKADRDGDLIGYYEPEDDADRAMARKRFLSPTQRISPQEVFVLLDRLLEHSHEEARRAAETMRPSEPVPEGNAPCGM